MAAEAQIKKEKAVPLTLIGIFIILTAGIIITGHLFYRSYEKHYRIEVERQLTAIADLKAAELVQWRRERIGDAEIIYKNAALSDLVRRYFRDPQDTEAQRRINEWISQYTKQYDYDQIRLLDPEGITRMSFPSGRTPASAAVLKHIPEVLRSGQITIVDLYRHDQDQRIYLSVLIPILDVSAGNRAIAVLSMRVDPEKYLYPFILRWPTPSRTAETLIVRREGDEVLYLNELKFKKDAALQHSISLKRTDIPGVMAVLGRTGIVEGMDYRGDVPVIADVRSVPDSPWFLVARINTSEVYAPLRERMWTITGFVMALIFSTGASLAFVWRHQGMVLYEERYKTAEALRESEDIFRHFMEYSPIFVFFKDENIRALRLSRNFETMLGKPIAELLGKNMDDLFPSELAKSMIADDMRIIKEGKVVTVEEELNGRSYSTTKFPVFIKGKPRYLAGFTLDITERKKAEEDLKALLSRQKALLEAVPDIIMEVDNNKVYTWANQPGIEFFGEDVIGKKAAYYFEGEQATYDVVKPLFNGSENVIYIESWQRRKDGQKRLLAWWCKGIKNESGNVIGALSSARDITEHKKAENALREAKGEIERWNREMENRVNEKTAELERTHKQLIQSEKLSAMGRLSAGLAHELNSPLAGLLPMMEKYRSREKEGTVEFRDMTLMFKACEYMARIIRDFNAFSRRSEEEYTPLNINNVIESTLSFTADSIEKKGIRIIRQYGNPLPDISGNKTEIQQVAVNLLTNARDSMPDGGEIIIKTSIAEDRKDVVMEFIDTGTGIGSENLGKIFDPFFTTKGVAEGTGLGLSVSYGIIKNHGGDISVESTPGKGSRSIVSLPAVN